MEVYYKDKHNYQHYFEDVIRIEINKTEMFLKYIDLTDKSQKAFNYKIDLRNIHDLQISD